MTEIEPLFSRHFLSDMLRETNQQILTLIENLGRDEILNKKEENSNKKEVNSAKKDEASNKKEEKNEK